MRKSTLGWLAAAAAAAGLIVAALARSPRGAGARRRMDRARRPGASLGALKNAILGASRGAVAAGFGPPGGSAAPPPPPAPAGRGDYWHADTCYSPIAPGRRGAVAIRFQGAHAQGVQFIAGPGVGQTDSEARR